MKRYMTSNFNNKITIICPVTKPSKNIFPPFEFKFAKIELVTTSWKKKKEKEEF